MLSGQLRMVFPSRHGGHVRQGLFPRCFLSQGRVLAAPKLRHPDDGFIEAMQIPFSVSAIGAKVASLNGHSTALAIGIGHGFSPGWDGLRVPSRKSNSNFSKSSSWSSERIWVKASAKRSSLKISASCSSVFSPIGVNHTKTRR